MKKLDKLILTTFIKKFLITFFVILFIFLIQYIVTKKLKDLLGKDLSIDTIGELLFYFCVILIPFTLPIAVLFTSLVTLGTLGQHNELTAIKSSGISLLRIIRSVIIFVCFLVLIQIVIHDKLVTWASLKGFTLLYNIKIKKPTLDLEENIFYNGIPGYSIKISKKDRKTKTLSDIIIYDHTQNNGNTNIVMAKKGRMFADDDGIALNMHLFNGRSFRQEKKGYNKDIFWKQSFDSAFFTFNLSSFSMGTIDEKLFTGHNQMKEIKDMKEEVDSLRQKKAKYFQRYQKDFVYNLGIYDNPKYPVSPTILKKHNKSFKGLQKLVDSSTADLDILYKASQRVQRLGSTVQRYTHRSKNNHSKILRGYIDINKRLAGAFSIFAFFIIAAPLALMIKKGGLGVPALIAIILYALYYVLMTYSNKLSIYEILLPQYGTWSANIIFMFIGLFLLQRAAVDARVFETNPQYWKNLKIFRFRKKISK